MTLGIILGSSLLQSTLFSHLEEVVIETTYGQVKCMKGKIQDKNVVIIRRHQFDVQIDYIPPHKINYHAMIDAFKISGCKKIVALYEFSNCIDFIVIPLAL